MYVGQRSHTLKVLRALNAGRYQTCLVSNNNGEGTNEELQEREMVGEDSSLERTAELRKGAGGTLAGKR